MRRAEETLAKGWTDVPAWVFRNEQGRPIWKSDFERRVFHKALAKAQLRRIRFHDLRHTFEHTRGVTECAVTPRKIWWS